jgi:Transcriptional regulators
MKALREAGLAIPGDVAVAGFDDIAMASFAQPPLSTVQQDTKLAGEVLVESLIRLVQREPVESRRLPVRLVLRESSRRPG